MTGKTIGTTRRKIWFKEHGLEAIMVVMFAAFFTTYGIDKSDNRQDHKDINTRIDVINTDMSTYSEKFHTVALVLIKDPNTDPELKEILIDYIKLNTRSNNSKQ